MFAHLPHCSPTDIALRVHIRKRCDKQLAGEGGTLLDGKELVVRLLLLRGANQQQGWEWDAYRRFTPLHKESGFLSWTVLDNGFLDPFLSHQNGVLGQNARIEHYFGDNACAI